jgi:putative oxidoreductase
MNPSFLSAVRIALGLLFVQHGAEKLWGFAGGQIDHNFTTLHGFAGPLEVIGGTLIIFGLFTRLAAFILSGQMAVAYFDQWAGRGFFPIGNGGEEAVIFCFAWLWLVTAGSGRWSIDNLLGPESNFARTLSGWEPWGRAIARVILAFLFILHGCRHVFGFLRGSAGRAAVVPYRTRGGLRVRVYSARPLAPAQRRERDPGVPRLLPVSRGLRRGRVQSRFPALPA